MSDWHQRILGREADTLRRLGLRVTKARENVLRLTDGSLAVRIFRERPGRFVAELRSVAPDLSHSETRTEYMPDMALQAAILRYTDSLADGPLPCRLEAARLLFGAPVDVCALLPGDGWQGLRHRQAGLLFARGCERAHFTHWSGAPGGAVGCTLSLLRTPDGHVLARGHGRGGDVASAIAAASADYLPRVHALSETVTGALRGWGSE